MVKFAVDLSLGLRREPGGWGVTSPVTLPIDFYFLLTYYKKK